MVPKNLDLDAKSGVPHPLSHLAFTSSFKSTSVIMIPTAYHHPTNSGIKNLDLCTVSSGLFLSTFYYLLSPLTPQTLQSQLYSIHHPILRTLSNPCFSSQKTDNSKKEKHGFSGFIGPTKLRIRLLLSKKKKRESVKSRMIDPAIGIIDSKEKSRNAK